MGLLSIADRLFEHRIKSRSGKPWSKSAVHKFLTNKLYVGIMEWGDKTYEGKYVPIITPELFAAVQRALKNRSKPGRVRATHDFPFRGLFRCSCGSMITARWAKGNGGTYRYYHCVRKGRICSERYMREHAVAEQCAATLKPLTIARKEAEAIRAIIEDRARHERQTSLSDFLTFNRKLTSSHELTSMRRSTRRATAL